jgi:hypothetical protein
MPGFLTQRAGSVHPPLRRTDAVTAAALEAIVEDVALLRELVPEIDLAAWPSCAGVS